MRSTCVYVRKLPWSYPYAPFSRFTSKDRKIERTVSGSKYSISKCWILGSWVQRAWSYVHSIFLQSSAKKWRMYVECTVLSCVYFEMFYFEPLEPEIYQTTRRTCLLRTGSENRLYFRGTQTPWTYSYALSSRVTPKGRKIGRTACSTYVYVHKCVAEECRISTRPDQTRCTQYAR